MTVAAVGTAGQRGLRHSRVLAMEFQYLLQTALLVGQVPVHLEVLAVQGLFVISYFRCDETATAILIFR